MMTYVAMLAWAITSLCPWVPPKTARQYAKIIQQESAFRDIAATWLAAHVYVESRYKSNHRSSTNDYGLGQCHVAARGSATFLGRERLLYIPRVNLRETARLADMWRGYHMKTCPVFERWRCGPSLLQNEVEYMRSDQSDHHFWSHMKFGYKVKNTASADLVAAIVELIILQMGLAERIYNAKRAGSKTLVKMGSWDS